MMNTILGRNKNVFAALILGFILGSVMQIFNASDSGIGNVWQADELSGGGMVASTHVDRGDLSIAIPFLPYPEKPWRTDLTISARLVASTPFSRFEIHKVKTEDGQIINDWLWQDERSHVNIVVHLKQDNTYLIFKQRKYGFDGAKLAIVGGLFNANDTPMQCAERELLEETGLEAGEIVDLGVYRVQANRGGGMLYAFLAKDCIKSSHKAKAFEADYESQQVLKLSFGQLKDVLLRHEFGEAQHAGVVALALLQEQTQGRGK